MAKQDPTVTAGEAGHDFTCALCGFVSAGWPSKAQAQARGEQHAAEHETGEPMPELSAFRAES